MRKQTLFKNIACVFIAVLALPFILGATTKGVKTSYKKYSIFTYENEDILCEPYTVNKDDWLYKIFRKKGEISERDFPRFITIFKKINPRISNIDAIEPGIDILIPLKKVKKQDYDQSAPGTISVPVIEFSAKPEDLNLKPFIKKHRVKRGETVSDLIDKDFMDKGGLLSEEGLKAFQLANPNIKNINLVYEGTQIYLPDPSIKKEPWFMSLFSKNTENIDHGAQIIKEKTPIQPEIEAHELAQLKKYASLIGGTLLNSGKIYFPGADGSGKAIDLAHTPIIETRDGSKVLIISGNTPNKALLAHIQNHWRNLKTQALSESLNKLHNTQVFQKKKSKTLEHRKMVKSLLEQTDYEYISNAKIPFRFNKIQLEARFGRIIRESTTDLLVNFGNVYGTALEIIEKKEFDIVSITPKLSAQEAIKTLFGHLGFSTWENPSFYTGESVEALNGIYLVKNDKKMFIPFSPLKPSAVKYLEKQNALILSFNHPLSN